MLNGRFKFLEKSQTPAKIHYHAATRVVNKTNNVAGKAATSVCKQTSYTPIQIGYSKECCRELEIA